MLTLRDLQLEVEAVSSIEETRIGLTEAFKFYSGQPDNRNWVETILKTLRNDTKYDTWPDEDIFFYNEEYYNSIVIPANHYDYSFGLFERTTFKFGGRLIYPVRDSKNMIAGFCAWDPTSEYKYIDSKTYGYKPKSYMIYGMENILSYYTSDKPVFVVEGIACCNYLRSKGYHSLALLGSYVSTYIMEVLKRFNHKLVCIVDSDEAGIKWGLMVKKACPSARVLKSIVAKDVDDTRVTHEPALLRDLEKCSNIFSLNEILLPI